MYTPLRLQYRDVLFPQNPTLTPQLQVVVNNVPYCRLEIEAECSICLDSFNDVVELRITIEQKTYAAAISPSLILNNGYFLQWLDMSLLAGEHREKQKKTTCLKILLNIEKIGKTKFSRGVRCLPKQIPSEASVSFEDTIINKLDRFPNRQTDYTSSTKPTTPLSNFNIQSKYTSNHFDHLVQLKHKTLCKIFQTFDVRKNQQLDHDQNVFQLG